MNEYDEGTISKLKKTKAGLEADEADEALADADGKGDPEARSNITKAKAVVDSEIADEEIDKAEQVKKKSKEIQKGR